MPAPISDQNILEIFTKAFIKVITKYTDYILVSGFVVIASGRIRGTEDIDMIVKPIPEQKFVKMHEELVHKGFMAMQGNNPSELYTYLKNHDALRYYGETIVPHMELKFSKDKLDEYQFETRTKLSFTGLPFWFSSVNMNIAFKEYLLKSPKDLEDARHLRIIYPKLVDEREIKKIAGLIKRYRL